jgi:hypothetical protein
MGKGRLFLGSKTSHDVVWHSLIFTTTKGENMRLTINRKLEEGKVGWVFLWLIGIPIPVLLILFLLRGCT